MNDPILSLPGQSHVRGKRIEVKFDGGLLSSDDRRCAEVY
jgi:hypothetical protein